MNTQDVDGHTALIWAADKGNIEVVNHLLAHKDCDPNKQVKKMEFEEKHHQLAQDHDGLSALICAASTGQLEMVKRLLECDQVDVNLQVVAEGVSEPRHYQTTRTLKRDTLPSSLPSTRTLSRL